MKYPELLALFQERKLRLTPVRRALIEVFSDSPLPLSVSEILRELKKDAVKGDRTTVYREIERWEKMELLDRTRLNDDEFSYELKRKHHHHLVCLSCERVEDVALDEEMIRKEEKKALTEKRFATIRHSLEFFGFCNTCKEQVC